MGRKGVSKRKPSQTKLKPYSVGDAVGSVTSALQALEGQPARSIDTSKAVASSKAGENRRKTLRKG